ncbi:unnamed protein product, partial [Mesorhabditis belari]|uniref:3-phosphoinositide-dependent protein kinase 1 n=1 Tax=Mesorhabditis belari TaxID=2138241 RepID=A0AAF3EEE2_9BILA
MIRERDEDEQGTSDSTLPRSDSDASESSRLGFGSDPGIAFKLTPPSSSGIPGGMVAQENKTPRDFFFVKTIGEGAFSTVYLAKEVTTSNEYAIKVISKELIQRQNKNNADVYSATHVIREKNIMASLTYSHGGHPFVVSLYCTFQDPERLYFAMSYCKRGELLTTLQQVGAFDMPTTRFYAAEILSGLLFLHKCNVVHRDLKPENILFQDTGHIAISDFGSAKMMDEMNKEDPIIRPSASFDSEDENFRYGEKITKRRSTFVGTAQYVSPEMLTGVGVGPACDFWAFGAIIYQMLSGQPPFRAVNDFHMMKKIQTLDYSFPEGFPEEPKDLVAKMLVLEPCDRLGSPDKGDAEGIMGHSFFEEIAWDCLPELEPPTLHPYLPAQGEEPAYYSELAIEPGLDEKALARLIGLQEFGGQSTNYSIDEEIDALMSPPATTPSADKNFNVSIDSAKALFNKNERTQKRNELLEKQRTENPYHRFVDENLILKSGFLDKKKGLFSRKRMFLLTEGPHLYYVDPVNMELKGEIPWSSCMRTEIKNFGTFFVHTSNRTYYLYDPEKRSVDWCRAIDTVKTRYAAELAALGNAQTVDPSKYKKKTQTSPKKSKKKETGKKGKEKGEKIEKLQENQKIMA